MKNILKLSFLFQVAAEDCGRTGPGARWPRPSPGPPSDHHGQARTLEPESSSWALRGYQHFRQLLQKQVKVPDHASNFLPQNFL